MTESTPLESALKSDRWWIGGALAAGVALCWWWLLVLARDMYGAMDGASAWMASADWGATHLLLLFAMWQVMMAGMMLPSAAPTLLLYAGVQRRSVGGAGIGLRIHAFAAGYLLAWAGFSAAATLAQTALTRLLWLTPMMQVHGRAAGAALLLVAGAYQLTPAKRNCLQNCRSPAAYISRHWRPGVAGALRMGLGHGLYCVGCCWALMLLLFAGGVMNLYWIAAITLFVLLEKLAPAGVQGGRLSGYLLLAAGAALMAAAALHP